MVDGVPDCVVESGFAEAQVVEQVVSIRVDVFLAGFPGAFEWWEACWEQGQS
jgi:hypothetical protein